MFKTAIYIAVFLPAAAFAAIPVLAPRMHTQQPKQGQSPAVIGTDGAAVFDHLSMGPDPGGKTGDTVTPATTKTGQPSADGPATSNQSPGQPGAGRTAAPEVASDNRNDPGTGSTSGPATSKP